MLTTLYKKNFLSSKIHDLFQYRRKPSLSQDSNRDIASNPDKILSLMPFTHYSCPLHIPSMVTRQLPYQSHSFIHTSAQKSRVLCPSTLSPNNSPPISNFGGAAQQQLLPCKSRSGSRDRTTISFILFQSTHE